MIKLNTELKPRPLRLGEIIWDVSPFIVGFFLILLILKLNRAVWPPPDGIAAAFTPISIALAYVIPIGHACMMQLSGHEILRRITLLEWRESLYLSGIEARPYLLSQLKARAIFQSIPFGVGAVFSVLGAGFGIALLGEEKTPLASFGFGAAIIFGLFCLQFCALCAGHLGHLDRLRSLCPPNSSDIPLYFFSLKWIAIIGITPVANGLTGALLGELATGIAEMQFGVMADSPSSMHVRAATIAVYSIVMCATISVFLYRRLRDSWKKAQEEFFAFE